ncbi:MAG: hypothetical protein KUG76_03375, partial [Gammaproteobacteria bacterium]|nr:hypothetical protein [Gammaproteobacteria bacterium]
TNVSAHTIYLINLLKNVSAQNRGANYTPLKPCVNKFFSVIQELVDQSRRISAPFFIKGGGELYAYGTPCQQVISELIDRLFRIPPLSLKKGANYAVLQNNRQALILLIGAP